MSSFRIMGDYAGYIWSAYGLSALGLAVATAWTMVSWRRSNERIADLEEKQPCRIPSRPAAVGSRTHL